MPGATPDGIVGLELEGRGFDVLAKDLAEANKHLASMEGSVSRMGQGLTGVARTMAGMAGLTGIGAVVRDFFSLETAANRAAIAIGNVTGQPGGYQGLMRAGGSAGTATGWMGTDILAGVAQAQALTGGGYFTNPQAAGGHPVQAVGNLLGQWGNLTGMDPSAAGGQLGGIAQLQRQTAGSFGGIAGTIASQAQMAGMGGQTGTFASIVQGLMGASVSLDPRNAGAGLSRGAGSIAGLMLGLNPIYRDPERLQAGIGAVQGGLTGAVGNPAMQAWLQMNGIGYKEQRQGIVKNPDTLMKIVAGANRQYPNATARDLFYRSQFGLEGANVLNEIGEHPGRSKKLLQKFNDSVDPQGGLLRIGQANQQTMKTSVKELQQLRQGTELLLLNIFQDVHAIARHLKAPGIVSEITGGKVKDTIFSDLLGLAVGAKGLKMLGVGKGGAGGVGGLSGDLLGPLALGLGVGVGGLDFAHMPNPKKGKDGWTKFNEWATNGLKDSVLGPILGGLTGDLFGGGSKKKGGKTEAERLTDALDNLTHKLTPGGGIQQLGRTPGNVSFQGLGKDPQGLGTTSFASMVGSMQYAGYQSAALMVGLMGSGGGGGGNTTTTPVSDVTPGGSPSGGNPAGSTPSGGYTPTSWAREILSRLGITPSDSAMQAMVGWAKAEGGHWVNDAKYNPLNTKMPMPGATKLRNGVYSYKSWQQGNDATVKTLKLPYYKGILAALKRKSASAVATAIGSSPWGTVASLAAKAISEAPKHLGGSGGGGGGGGGSGGGGSHGGSGPQAQMAGGMTLGGGFGSDSGGPTVINVNVDGRRMERYTRLTRAL